MINNGTIHYDHDRDGTHTMIGGCEVKFRNFEHDTWIAIRYENDVLTGFPDFEPQFDDLLLYPPVKYLIIWYSRCPLILITDN
jgi:hypothetical protein